MDRRKFLKTSGMALAGSLVFPEVIRGQITNQKEKLPAMMNHFGVGEQDLRQVMNIALEKGGDYADFFFEHTFSNSLSLMDGEVNRAYSNIDYGVGIRVVSGDQQGYAFVEDVNLEEMKKAARVASRIANGSAKTPPINMTEMTFKNHYPIVKSWEDVSVQEKIPYLQALNKRIFELDKRVIKVNASISDSTSYILYYNSEGLLCHEVRPMIVMSAQCIMQEGEKIENAYSSLAARKDVSFLTDEKVEHIAKEAVDQASRMFLSVRPKGGEMPVVMAAGSSGILLHEAIGHTFEADFNRKKTSIFSDKLGKIICDKHINVVDDGTIEYDRGSVNFDDEGVAGQKTYIVKEGKLTSYLHDRISAKHYGVDPTGNGRRESFRFIPIPRMRSTYMENGNYTEEEIIAQVKQGVYVDNFTNGQVQIGAGDFTFFVKSGYLIENGKLTKPIKDINIIGNGAKALADIEMVGNNMKIDQGSWTCGKNGQGMPVSQGLPSVLVKQLTVGGE
ncbi:TldD/PmbA family protein [Bacteroidales bacterium OttesenSCG-928-L03]|nr:TldD/PmbA family protein [Bacteroidales bacterium OttesenSCG-928-L03]MDL2241469.1 TldD/PmbA family protein [Bacteroidales bacterium OttesenSCG-928-L03]